MTTTEQMKQIVEKHLKAFSSGDWNAYKQLLTDSANYEEEATRLQLRGPDKIVNGVQVWKRAFSDLKATIKQTVGSGDALVIELEWEGTHDGVLTGPFGSIPPTHKKGKVPAVEVVRFDGDKIREIRHYFDLLTILAQIGAAPQMGAPQPGSRP